MFRRIVGVTFVVALVLASGAHAGVAAAPLQPADGVRAAGVVGYQVHEASGTVEINLLDQGESTLGEVVVRSGDFGYSAELRSGDRLPIAMAWNQAKGILEIKEVGSDRIGYSYFDFQAFDWKAEPAFDDLVNARKADVDLLMGVVADYDAGRGHGGSTLAVKQGGGSCASKQQPLVTSPLGEIAAKGIVCTGYTCRGFGTGAAKSLCCQDATNDANVCCWNSVCIGCCSFLSCDAACGIGDYICFCGRTGTSCDRV